MARYRVMLEQRSRHAYYVFAPVEADAVRAAELLHESKPSPALTVKYLTAGFELEPETDDVNDANVQRIARTRDLVRSKQPPWASGPNFDIIAGNLRQEVEQDPIDDLEDDDDEDDDFDIDQRLNRFAEEMRAEIKARISSAMATHARTHNVAAAQRSELQSAIDQLSEKLDGHASYTNTALGAMADQVTKHQHQPDFARFEEHRSHFEAEVSRTKLWFEAQMSDLRKDVLASVDATVRSASNQVRGELLAKSALDIEAAVSVSDDRAASIESSIDDIRKQLSVTAEAIQVISQTDARLVPYALRIARADIDV